MSVHTAAWLHCLDVLRHCPATSFDHRLGDALAAADDESALTLLVDIIDRDAGTPEYAVAARLVHHLTEMVVTVRDRSAEMPWGVGLIDPVTRKIVISAYCPQCGGRRGEPRGRNAVDDGAYYWVQVWDNPCGHVDAYTAVIREAAKRATS